MEAQVHRILVRELYEGKARALGFRLGGGVNGLDNQITSPRIQKLGLALAGYTDSLHPGRVQFAGRTEINYLSKLDDASRKTAASKIFQLKPCCVVVTYGLTPPDELSVPAQECGVPLLQTDVISPRAMDEVSEFLEQRLAPSTTIHAVLMEVFGLGVLILGESGIGKSECALDLVLRGHRLVSDDHVMIRRHGTGRLVGTGPDFLQFHMELRGLGIINIRDLFGISSVSVQKQIDIALELVRWREKTSYDRVGLEEMQYELLDTSIPMLAMPVASGRNVATLVEVAVRIHMLRKQGYEPAAHFMSELEDKLRQDSVDQDGSGM
jgi:HPr kinase/phosphorylase